MKTSSNLGCAILASVLILGFVFSCLVPDEEGQKFGQSINEIILPCTNMLVRFEILNVGNNGSSRNVSNSTTDISTFGVLSVNSVTDLSLDFDLFHIDEFGVLSDSCSYSLSRINQDFYLNGESVPVFGCSDLLAENIITDNSFLVTFIKDVDIDIGLPLPGDIKDKDIFKLALLGDVFNCCCCYGVTPLCGKDITIKSKLCKKCVQGY